MKEIQYLIKLHWIEILCCFVHRKQFNVDAQLCEIFGTLNTLISEMFVVCIWIIVVSEQKDALVSHFCGARTKQTYLFCQVWRRERERENIRYQFENIVEHVHRASQNGNSPSQWPNSLLNSLSVWIFEINWQFLCLEGNRINQWEEETTEESF